MINFIVKFFTDTVIKVLRNFWNKYKRDELKQEVKIAKEISDESVKKADDSYDDFMSEYDKYKSDSEDK